MGQDLKKAYQHEVEAIAKGVVLFGVKINSLLRDFLQTPLVLNYFNSLKMKNYQAIENVIVQDVFEEMNKLPVWKDEYLAQGAKA